MRLEKEGDWAGFIEKRGRMGFLPTLFAVAFPYRGTHTVVRLPVVSSTSMTLTWVR